MRCFARSFALCLFAAAAACSTAEARPPAQAVVLSQEKSPYTIELVDEVGASLETYRHKGRFYVLGDSGDRYSVRIENPTAQRVEAVISVDGLDVIDGETADFRNKRGYIVPAYGSLTIDGFRVSTSQVAAFRFSSVKQSYAGRKGKARNVGVIGVALFAERANAQIALPTPLPTPQPIFHGDDRVRSEHVDSKDARESLGNSGGHGSGSGSGGGHGRVSKNIESEADGAEDAAPEPFRPAPARAPRSRAYDGEGRAQSANRRAKEERPGLGTEFGERRYSSIIFTPFVRQHPSKSTAIAELRYNDSRGLIALGIELEPEVDAAEIELRESASSFPGSRFAQPPGY